MFDEYVAVNENAETCEQLTDDDIITAVTSPAEPGSATPSNEEKEEGETPPRSTSQVVYRIWRPWTLYSVTCWASATGRIPR